MPRSVAGAVHGVTVAFTLFSYGAMLAGSGALAQQEMGLPLLRGLVGNDGCLHGNLDCGEEGTDLAESPGRSSDDRDANLDMSEPYRGAGGRERVSSGIAARSVLGGITGSAVPGGRNPLYIV